MNYINVFDPNNTNPEEIIMLTEAKACLDRFSDAFNNEDIAGMDAECHFPHLLISGSDVITWEQPGQMHEDFFRLLRESGWATTTCEKCEPVLISPDKIHYLWSYARRDNDGEILTFHENLWILTKVEGRWGIAVRSY